ncbi:hypothetical protein CcCBS67573_g02643 [Chytriomyces confervae]|uniref:Uncharacterized protein n=1 Tax=Chytriomyces confervae TaxID=246404 RepID=A0A507FM43_9FUNG|nr:hypothetical protein CcCBS67573_g02643 [Chytriomyces confervae]
MPHSSGVARMVMPLLHSCCCAMRGSIPLPRASTLSN